jgi:CheY-like chemotaxis protein
MRHGKILVVDDDRNLLGVISAMLSRLGHDVDLAESGEKGLVVFFKNPFDIVLSDYQMPGMDGIALACAIKKNSPRTPVLIMTGASRENVLFRKSPAVDEVIAKPFTLAFLDETIQRHIGQEVSDLTYPPLSPGYRSVCGAR